MSGVNCTRRKSTPSARAVAFASSVFATPGAPSSRTWPPTTAATSSCSTTCVLADDDLAHLARRGGRAARSLALLPLAVSRDLRSRVGERERGCVVDGRAEQRVDVPLEAELPPGHAQRVVLVGDAADGRERRRVARRSGSSACVRSRASATLRPIDSTYSRRGGGRGRLGSSGGPSRRKRAATSVAAARTSRSERDPEPSGDRGPTARRREAVDPLREDDARAPAGEPHAEGRVVVVGEPVVRERADGREQLCLAAADTVLDEEKAPVARRRAHARARLRSTSPALRSRRGARPRTASRPQAAALVRD